MGIDFFSAIFCLPILAYACQSDIRKRSVSNIPWIVMLVVGVLFAIYRGFIYGVSFLMPFIYSLTLTSALCCLFFRFGLFGGADAKCLISIAILFPTQPVFTAFSYNFPLLNIPATFPFSLKVLLNAAVLVLTIPFFLLSHNLRSLGLKGFIRNAWICFIAYKVSIDDLSEDKFVRLAHRYEERGGHLVRRCSIGGVPLDDSVIRRLKDYRKEGKVIGEVWVTPELPFILFISIGFISSCLLGV